MRIVFMGSPDFAVPVLEELISNPDFEVAGVVSQPDKAKGRKQELVMTPVSEAAIQHEIELFRPAKLSEPGIYDKIKELAPDAIVVVAYGQILKKDILELPKYGCINVHASLLPKWRGASPIQSSVLAGDKVTGITTMFMNEGLDTGDILLTKEIEIGDEETSESLFDKMAQYSPKLLVDTLKGLEEGSITPIKQDEEKATYSGKITKDMGKVSWDMESDVFIRHIRALSPWPGVYINLENGKTLKIFLAKSCKEDYSKDKKDIPAGSILEIKKESMVIKTADGAVEVFELQLSGKKRMNAAQYLRGTQYKVMDILK